MSAMRSQLFNLRSEQVKFNAFFQYLKSFSEQGLDTLQKLENQFNKEMRKKMKHSETLSTVKNLLSSYEIFILGKILSYKEIKDSCDFVQISEFGYCVGKTFVQLLKIIKWFLKFWLKDTRKTDNGKASLQSQTGEDLNLNHQNICAFCEQIIKSSPCGRQNKGKRKGVAINDINTELRQAKMMHKREITHLMDRKELILERYTQKQIQSKKFIGDYSEIDLLNKKHIAMKLQISNNQTVLEEVLNEFSMKTEAIARFVTNTQASSIQDFKINQESDFVQFQDQMRILIAEKYGEAREKMKELVSQRLMDYDRARRQRLTNQQVQTVAQDSPSNDKYEIKLKQMNAAYQKLKNELESEKSLNQSLKQLLQSKSIQFEKQFLNFRKQVIKSDVKSKHYLKSLKSFKQGIEESMRQDDDQSQASIKLEDACSETSSFKHHMTRITSSNLKDKVKNRYSIKFTLENNQPEDVNHSLSGTIKFKPLKQDAEIQTDYVHIFDETHQTIKRNSRKSLRNQTAKSLFSQDKNLKQALQKTGIKKSHTNIYNHVKSKIVNMIQKQSAKSVKTMRKDFKQTRSSFMGELSKKLSVEYLFPRSKQTNPQPIKIYKITGDPTYNQIISFVIGNQDISNLFLNEGNAKNYQCLMYRNSLMNLAHQNKKRLINYSERLESSDMQWMKKEVPVNESVESKVVHAFYHQLNSLKRRQKSVYEQVKRLLRCPYEISKKVEVFQLEQFEVPSNDIEVSELKRMLGIILKFHCECLGQEREALCEHLVNFSKKLGIDFL